MNNDKRIHLKDILIPLFSALVAVSLNQFFFENNRRVEAQIEYQKENLQRQTPVLNRILAFTYKYERTQSIHVITHQEQTDYIDDKTKEIIQTKTRTIHEKQDTLSFLLPSFVAKKKKREHLLVDLKYIMDKRDFLGHEIYIAFDKVIDFLDSNPIPDSEDPYIIEKSTWTNESVQTKWYDIISELREKSYTKIEEIGKSS